jgi:hypothetical protein
MTLWLYFNARRFLENGKCGLRKVALLFSPMLGFWTALCFGHGASCHESPADDIQFSN